MDNESIAPAVVSHRLHPKIPELVHLFHDYEWVFNFKMTELLFHENLQKVPTELKLYFQSLGEGQECDNSGIETLVNCIVCARPEECNEFMPTVLRTFVCKVRDLRNSKTLDEIESISTNEVIMQRKWAKKKSEEVKYLAQFVGDMCAQHSCDLVVDIGSGLGYLSTFLVETYKIPVVAIESHSEKTVSARVISSKTCGDKLEEQNSKESKVAKVAHVNIELTSNIANEISQFITGKNRICITGLHSCGDLTPWSLKLFLSDSKYNVIAIVPCCYHKMNFDSEQYNFPLSNGLTELLRERYSLEKSQANFLRNAYFCRLASQRLGEGILWDIENEGKHVFYRALLEMYAKADNYELRKLKRNFRMGKRLSTFDDYLQKAIGPEGGFEIINKLGNSNLSPPKTFEEHRQSLLQLHEEKKYLIVLASGLNAMQAALQQLAEEIILLDRMECLLESGKVGQATIKRVIPSDVTPRGCVIFATKL